MSNTTKKADGVKAGCGGVTQNRPYSTPELTPYGKMKDLVRTGQDMLIDDSGMYDGIVGTMS